MQILTWILAYGIAKYLFYGSIFESTRNLIHELGNPNNGKISIVTNIFKFISDLISLYMCTSTWVGFLEVFLPPFNDILNLNNLCVSFLMVCWLWFSLERS